MEEDEFNLDTPVEPTDDELDSIESVDKWEWNQDQIVFDDEEWED
jgi:hypothetical protein|tara:strand:+ start:1089 stop:1223 length:135 start_codon:yes stop_codon:yes gene_type:complete